MFLELGLEYNKKMAVYSKQFFSASINGKPIAVTATQTLGTLIHTATNSTTGFDEIWLYAVNSSPQSTKLTIEFGDTTNAENIELSVLGESGLVLVIPGLILNNSLNVRAFAGIASAINIVGYVNRIL